MPLFTYSGLHCYWTNSRAQCMVFFLSRFYKIPISYGVNSAQHSIGCHELSRNYSSSRPLVWLVVVAGRAAGSSLNG